MLWCTSKDYLDEFIYLEKSLKNSIFLIAAAFYFFALKESEESIDHYLLAEDECDTKLVIRGDIRGCQLVLPICTTFLPKFQLHLLFVIFLISDASKPECASSTLSADVAADL